MDLTAAAIGLGAAGVAGNLIGSVLNYNAQQDNLSWQKIPNEIFLPVRIHLLLAV